MVAGTSVIARSYSSPVGTPRRRASARAAAGRDALHHELAAGGLDATAARDAVGRADRALLELAAETPHRGVVGRHVLRARRVVGDQVDVVGARTALAEQRDELTGLLRAVVDAGEQEVLDEHAPASTTARSRPVSSSRC